MDELSELIRAVGYAVLSALEGPNLDIDTRRGRYNSGLDPVKVRLRVLTPL